jgi:hypothetical protein
MDALSDALCVVRLKEVWIAQLAPNPSTAR